MAEGREILIIYEESLPDMSITAPQTTLIGKSL